MSRPALTRPQAHGLYALLKASAQKNRSFRALSKGGLTIDDTAMPWAMRIESRVAQKLVSLGFARDMSVMPDNREIHDADLVRFLGHWKTKYMITPRGLKFWQCATVRERYGLGEMGRIR